MILKWVLYFSQSINKLNKTELSSEAEDDKNFGTRRAEIITNLVENLCRFMTHKPNPLASL